MVDWTTTSTGLTPIDLEVMYIVEEVFPYSVEISTEHDGQDIQDWLIENGMEHTIDWKAIKMRHKGVYTVYFRDSKKAVMTKLRWSGVGF